MSVERKPSVMGAVLGNYRITGALGSGGMGAVFTAKHVTTGKPAAIKLLRKELTSNEELVQRFFTEARASTRILHPGIIEVYDFGYSADGVAYLVMELLEGITLRQRIEQKRVLPESEAVGIARAVAEALGAAHAAGIIHRDLKPDNIFLVGGDRPKILDFGIAKLLDRDTSEASRTRTGSLMGTPVYMAPEQARAAGAIDPRADLYSLGCILYEMVSGKPPFIGNLGELLAAHMFNEPAPLAMVSPPLAALIAKLLAKEPDDRPRDAATVVAALTARPARAFDDRPPNTLAPKRSAMPIIAAVATIAIAATAIGLVISRSGGDDAPPPITVGKPVVPEPMPVAPVAPAVVTPLPPPQATPPGPVPIIVVKKQPKPRPTGVEHPAVDHSTGPVTMPTGPVTMPDVHTERKDQPVTQPDVTPKGAPLGDHP